MAPDNPVAFLNRALCLAEVNRKSDALADLSRTLELQPDFYWALCYKADLLVQTGDTTNAMALYKQAIAKDPDTPYAQEKLSKLDVEATSGADPASGKTSLQAAADSGPGAVYALQAGAFKNPSNAEHLKERLVRNGFDARILVMKDSKDTPWYLVRSGSYATQQEAERFMAAIREKLDVRTVVRPHDSW
jgi:cell division protein FtsN